MNGTSDKRGVKWTIAIAIAAAGGFFAWQHGNQPSQKESVAFDALYTKPGDGQQSVNMPGSKSSGKIPPAVADMLTSATKPGTYQINGPQGHGVVVTGSKGNGTGSGSGSGTSMAWDPEKGEPPSLPAGLQGIGQAKADIDNLIKSGMPRDEAIRAVEKGLDESLNAKNSAQGGGVAHTHIEYGEDGRFSMSSRTTPPGGNGK